MKLKTVFNLTAALYLNAYFLVNIICMKVVGGLMSDVGLRRL